MPVIGGITSDIDEAHLWSFLREFEGDAFDQAVASGYPTGDVLERDLLLATEYAGEAVPTVAGLLLFGRDERVRELLPRSAITATRLPRLIQSPVVERVSITAICSRSMKRPLRLLFATRICGTPGRRVFPRVRLTIVQWPREGIISAPLFAKPLVIYLCIAISRAQRSITRLNIFDHS